MQEQPIGMNSAALHHAFNSSDDAELRRAYNFLVDGVRLPGETLHPE